MEGPSPIQERDTVIDNLRVYITILQSMGIWDERLANAWWLLVQNHLANEEYWKAKRCAQAGLLVERHAYESNFRGALLDVALRCYDLAAGSRDLLTLTEPYPLL
ncbi:hypothetical protein PtrSN002B_009667 [Pyrenophora tritici-repentis]|nr:hypothetical protein Alg215_10113 [Pyrenophora tritici-repentis]KAI0573843.1 hypothetical protein Alg130_09933 [Pyrenophora tritici-repentis]KAI0605911.1 hypothetical protein TUN205_09838 [Pyrenophora tritici-repentis]KAI0618081.1 hypothetical protein TUN199_09923 [Pyrenophora tritici-repentis]KAI1528123.1 hypothetical protein PtrSN001A_009109 [Pyrenophora tritici-repentis]